MKTFEEIDPHLQIISDIDQRKDSGALDRRRAISGLVYRLADELIAGHPAPRSDDPGFFTRIDGLVPALANELVRQHDMAIAHRTHLAERLEADGGENGAKAAAILRGMNAMADIPMTTVQGREAAVLVCDALEALAPEFVGLQRAVHEAARDIGHDLVRSAGAYIAAAPKRLKGRAWVEDAKRRRDAGVPIGEIIREAGRDADLEAAEKRGYCAGSDAAFAIFETKIQEAELRGFDKGRNKALSIVLNERKNWSKDLVRDVLGKVSEAIVYMQKEG